MRSAGGLIGQIYDNKAKDSFYRLNYYYSDLGISIGFLVGKHLIFMNAFDLQHRYLPSALSSCSNGLGVCRAARHTTGEQGVDPLILILSPDC